MAANIKFKSRCLSGSRNTAASPWTKMSLVGSGWTVWQGCGYEKERCYAYICSAKEQLDNMSDYECNEVGDASFYGMTVEPHRYEPEYTVVERERERERGAEIAWHRISLVPLDSMFISKRLSNGRSQNCLWTQLDRHTTSRSCLARPSPHTPDESPPCLFWRSFHASWNPSSLKTTQC